MHIWIWPLRARSVLRTESACCLDRSRKISSPRAKKPALPDAWTTSRRTVFLAPMAPRRAAMRPDKRTTMKIGVFLFPEARDPSKDFQIINETIREAQLAEQQGMDALFLAEHHFDGNCVYVDPPTFAASLAMATNRIKIGFAVLQT